VQLLNVWHPSPGGPQVTTPNSPPIAAEPLRVGIAEIVQIVAEKGHFSCAANSSRTDLLFSVCIVMAPLSSHARVPRCVRPVQSPVTLAENGEAAGRTGLCWRLRLVPVVCCETNARKKQMMVVFDSVVKKYGPVTAVDGISLQIAPGEFCALLGPNGAGKTTMLKVMLDLLRPTSGSVSINGTPSTNPVARASVGYLAENHRIPGHLTALQYLDRHASLVGMDRSVAQKRIPEVLGMVGMSEKAKAPARTYSKGMTQRIGLGAALLHSPKFLILDEPVSGLDPIGIREVRMILERLKNDGVTVLLSSHLLSEAEKICGTVAIVTRGKLVIRDSVENLTRDGSSLEDVFVKAVQHGNA
jgi:ABC-2 type transport system ATP-binding protein